MKLHALLTLLLCGCVSVPTRPPTTPQEVQQGRARLILHAPYAVKVRSPWQMEVMLAGAPSAYPQPIYVLRLAVGDGYDLLPVYPSMQRYFLLKMAPFDPGFHPSTGTAVFVVSLHEIRGWDFTGQIQLKEPKLIERCVVRYTYTLEAAK